MKIINVIEIDPWDYVKNEYNSSDYSKTGRSEFWYKCITDSGLENLSPIELGSYLVDITEIGKFELKIILEKELKDVDLSDYQEYVGQIIGGIVITENEEIIIEPSCCGDLYDINSWENIELSKHNKWNQLWIGHPWLFYKKNDESIYFSDYTDLILEDFKDIYGKHQFDEKKLISEVKTARNNQNLFRKMISEVLLEMNINHSNEITKILTGD